MTGEDTAILILVTCALTFAGAGAAVAVTDRVRRESGSRRRWLVVLVVAGTLLFVGHVVSFGVTQLPPYPSLPVWQALPFSLTSAFILAALLALSWPEGLERNEIRTVATDVAVGALGLAIIWVVLVVPVIPASETWVGRLVLWISTTLQFASVLIVLAMAGASRRRSSMPVVQVLLLQMTMLLFIGVDVLSDSLPVHLTLRVIVLEVGYVGCLALITAFAVRPVSEQETAGQLWLRDAWSTLVPLSPVPIAAGTLLFVLATGRSATPLAASVIAGLLLVLIVAVIVLRLAARRELRRAVVKNTEVTFSRATDQAWFQALIQHSRDLVVVVDRHNRVVFASPTFCRHVGVSAPALTGRQLQSLVPELTEHVVRGVPRSVTDPGLPVDVGLADHHGVEHDVQFQIAPLVGLGVEGFVLTGEDVTDARRLRVLLGESRRRDRVTGLLNQDGFTGAVAEALGWSDPRSLAVLVLDLNNLRTITDARGGRVGEVVVRAMAAALERAPGPVLAVGRLSGEGFGVLLRDPSPDVAAAAITEEITVEMALVPMAGEDPVRVRVASGYTVGGVGGDHAGDLVEHADLAATHSSADPELALVRYDHEMRDALLREWERIAALEASLERGEFVPYYQPIVRLMDGKVVGVEALARRQRSDGTLQLPDEFIPLAESVGLVAHIDNVIRARALADLAELRREWPSLYLSVNVAPVEFRAGFAEAVMRQIAAAGTPPSAVTLEVTETTVARSAQLGTEIIAALRSSGCQVALDDFGTGFSSLAGLRSMDVDVLKIDQSFVSDLATSPRALAVMRAITDVGRGLGLVTVAEGVRTVEQADLLRGMGCDRGQGYLHSQPMSYADLRRWLAGPEPVAPAPADGTEGPPSRL